MSVINQRLSPEDAKAEAARINDVSDSILGHISERYQARKDKSKPLVVLLGEEHEDSSHRAVQLSVMSRLYQSFNPDVVSCGYEKHKGNLIKILEAGKKAIHHPQLPAQMDRVSKYLQHSCPDDPVNLAASAFYSNSLNSPKMYKTLHYVSLHKGYKSIFNDAAMTADSCSRSGLKIDLLDAKVLAYYQNFLDKEKAPDMAGGGACIDALSSHGVYFRNYFMACVADEHIKKHEPKLFIQLCGAAHVNGYGNDFSSREALAQILEREGHNVLGIALPSVVVKGQPAPENIINYEFDGAVKFPDGHTDLETDWMDAVLPHVLPDWSDNFMKRGKQLVCDHLLRVIEP